jgi:hypothetical protein
LPFCTSKLKKSAKFSKGGKIYLKLPNYT